MTQPTETDPIGNNSPMALIDRAHAINAELMKKRERAGNARRLWKNRDPDNPVSPGNFRRINHE